MAMAPDLGYGGLLQFNQNGVMVGPDEMQGITHGAQLYNQMSGKNLTPMQYDQMINPTSYMQRWGGQAGSNSIASLSKDPIIGNPQAMGMFQQANPGAPMQAAGMPPGAPQPTIANGLARDPGFSGSDDSGFNWTNAKPYVPNQMRTSVPSFASALQSIFPQANIPQQQYAPPGAPSTGMDTGNNPAFNTLGVGLPNGGGFGPSIGAVQPAAQSWQQQMQNQINPMGTPQTGANPVNGGWQSWYGTRMVGG